MAGFLGILATLASHCDTEPGRRLVSVDDRRRFDEPWVVPADGPRVVPDRPPEAKSRAMANQRTQETSAELRLRSALHRRGYRFRVHQQPVSGLRRTADLVFARQRLAVFVDGCFWHGCPDHGSWPKTNAAWWREKIDGNRRRDADTNERFAAAGWHVLRIWEHEPPEAAAGRVAHLLEALVATGPGPSTPS
jgi:DNA mismatch endonuclease, patch repair protein